MQMRNHIAAFLLLTTYYGLNVIGIKGFVIAPPIFGLEWWFGIVLLILSVLLCSGKTKIIILISWFVLLFWAAIQFWLHWRWLFVSVSDKEINWYNRVFGRTSRWFKISETGFMPDSYHTILHVLILLSVGTLSYRLFNRKYN
jgi:hypothetical protein